MKKSWIKGLLLAIAGAILAGIGFLIGRKWK